MEIAQPSHLDSVLTVKYPKILITQTFVYIFSLKSKQDEINDQQAGPAEVTQDDVEQERLDKINNETQVEVKDLQKYNLMDFEFLQKATENKQRTFVLQAYNKTKEKVENNP